MPEADSLVAIMHRCHHQIDELFLLHQESLVRGCLEGAQVRLEAYRRAHALHMQFEDEVLLPRLARARGIKRWPAALYSAEHVRGQALLERIHQRLQYLARGCEDGDVSARDIIELLDSEKTFKSFCEHHQEREEQGLFPELGGDSQTQGLRAMLDDFSQSWDKCIQRCQEIAESA